MMRRTRMTRMMMMMRIMCWKGTTSGATLCARAALCSGAGPQRDEVVGRPRSLAARTHDNPRLPRCKRDHVHCAEWRLALICPCSCGSGTHHRYSPKPGEEGTGLARHKRRRDEDADADPDEDEEDEVCLPVMRACTWPAALPLALHRWPSGHAQCS